MASVGEWRPFRELERAREEFERLMDRFSEDWATFPPDQIRPHMESFLEDGTLTVRTDLPGVDAKNVEVDVTGNVLTIRAKREQKPDERKRRFLRREIRYGTFERRMELPEGVKADDIRATYRDGVLELTTPVPKELQRKEVKVQIRREAPKSGAKEHQAT